MTFEGEPLEVRAFRGSRSASVYREHVVGHETFGRILTLGDGLGLPLLATLDEYGRHELDLAQARQFVDELGAVRAAAGAGDLAAELEAIAAVARWCATAPERDSWLTIVGP